MNNQLEQHIRTIIDAIKAIPDTEVREERVQDSEYIAEFILEVSFPDGEGPVVVYLF